MKFDETPHIHQIGQNIKRLRKAADMSLETLAEHIQSTQPYLSLVENGKTVPSSSILLKISHALNVPFSALSQNVLTRHWVHQRGKDKLTPDYYPVLEQIMSCYNELENLCHAPKFRQFPLDIPLKNHTDQDIEDAALMTRELFGIRHAIIYDVFELFESNGLRIVVLDLPKTIDGLAYLSPQNSQVTFFINHQATMERKIFTLVHELGHLIFHRQRTFSLEENNLKEEELVNRFAAAFLMPRHTVIQSVHSHGLTGNDWDMDILLKFKSLFGVSGEAFLKRLLHLNLVHKKVFTSLMKTIKTHYAQSGFRESGILRQECITNHRIQNLILILSKKGKRQQKTSEQLKGMLKELGVSL